MQLFSNFRYFVINFTDTYAEITIFANFFLVNVEQTADPFLSETDIEILLDSQETMVDLLDPDLAEFSMTLDKSFTAITSPITFSSICLIHIST